MNQFSLVERLLFLALMVFLASQGLFLLASNDLGLHLVAGAYTFHNGIPETNVFSPVNGNYPLVQHEWAFQVASYGITAAVGTTGLAWVRLIVVLAIGLVLHRTLRPGRGYVAGVGCLALGLFVAHPRFEWRPELFSLLLLAAVLKLLIDYVEGRHDRLMILPLLFLAWSNIHGYFLAGLIVIGCFAIGELGEERFRGNEAGRGMHLIRIGALCAIATLVNPYHYEGALYPFDVLIKLLSVDSQFTATVRELMPPQTFSDMWAVKAWYPLLVIFGLVSVLQGRRVRFGYLLTALAVWLMAHSTFRNIGVFGITLGVLAAVQWPNVRAWRLSRRHGEGYAQCCAIAMTLLLLGAAGFIGTNRLYIAEGSLRRSGAGVDRRLDPPTRVFIRDHIPADSQVFNSFDHGSRYLWWFYPERLPYIDGNGAAYPPAFFAEYREVITCRQPFEPFARRNGIGWVYLGLDKPLARCLYRSPAWHPVYLDQDGIVFVSQAPEFAELRRAFDLRADLAQGFIPDWEPTPLPTFLHPTTSSREHMLYRFLVSIGERRAARSTLKHAESFAK